jgi:hypothetical protein
MTGYDHFILSGVKMVELKTTPANSAPVIMGNTEKVLEPPTTKTSTIPVRHITQAKTNRPRDCR